jgi:hypothetical protein
MKRSLLFVALVLSLLGCIKNNPAPSYIEIKKFNLVANPNGNDSAGILTENISNAWVYVNDKLIGVFELPCKVPVLASGEASVRIYPAILNNGISATKKIYPFFNPHEETITLIQNGIVTIQPQTMYASSTKFWIEDFESSTMALNSGNPSPASITQVSDANNTYGRVVLNASQNQWAAYTNQALSFPIGSSVYLEVDYHNTAKIVTGMIALKQDGSQQTHLNIAMNAQDPAKVVWKKIYIDLQEIVGYSGGLEFLQTFQATLADGQTDAEIWIDNIKVVYF